MALFFPAVAQVSPNRPAIPLLRESGFKNIASEPLRTSFDFTLLRRTDRKTRKLGVSAAASSVLDEKDGGIEAKKEKLRVVVKPVERPRLMLKFVWMEKNIGIALDQVIPGGQGTIPLSPYYFWPRKDAWEELKTMLDSKPWIPQRQKVILLNQATDIINFWQK